MTATADICVVGGGPAGSLTALYLAALGYQVVLVTESPGQTRLECLPPSVWPSLRPREVRGRVQAAQFAECSAGWLRWSSPRITSRDSSAGLLVRRDRLDAILLDAARDRGVRVSLNGQVTRPEWNGSTWRVNEVRAGFLVDAAGRRGVLPGRRRRLSAPMVAVTATCSGPAVATGEMRVEGLRNGWAWAATAGLGDWEVTVFADTAYWAGGDRDARFRLMLAESVLLRDLRPPDGDLRICDASSWLADELVTSRSIRVGDAALARDPLSSQGVRAAAQGASQAAETVNTLLSGGDPRHAMARYEAMMHAGAQDHVATTAGFYAAGCWRSSAFWQRRSPRPKPADRGAVGL